MDRETLRYAAVALLGVLAVALGAATLPERVERETGAGETGSGSGGGGMSSPPTSDEPVETIDIPIPFLTELLQVVAVLLFLGFLVYVYYNREEAVGLIVGVIGVVLFFFYAFRSLTLSEPTPEAPFGFDNVTSLGGAAGDGQAAPTDPAIPPLVIVVGVALAIGLLVVVMTRMQRSTGPDPDDEDDADEMKAVGRAAGRAADRLEDEAEADNEIYRAWVEMTDLLNLAKPARKTPGEFATAAVDAGMDADDVSELTRLFEEVRYGEHEPTSADEQRAIEIFRRIEAAYAGEES